MPPKQTSEQIDVRLDELEAFIKSNAASIATVDADSMLAALSKRQRQCPEADKFRKWLHKTESRMSLLQQQRVIAIFELLTSSSQQQEQKQEQTSPSQSTVTNVLRELMQSIIALEQMESPESLALQQTRAPPVLPPPAFPPQLAKDEMISVPPDGLCLSHTCVAAFHAKKWRDEHGETGYRRRQLRSEEQAEERQARCFRAQVVQLMREYAVFDQARAHYNQRALAIETGGMPEAIDIPFYAACLNGCIQVEPWVMLIGNELW